MRSANANAIGVAAVVAVIFAVVPLAANAVSADGTHCSGTTGFPASQCALSFGKTRVAAGHQQDYATGALFVPGETIGGILHCRARHGGHFDHLVPPGHAGRHGGADGVFTVPGRARRDCTLVLHGRSSDTQIEGRFSVSR